MTPAQILIAATRNSAEILGLDDLGTVAEGTRADVASLDANPLDDITHTRRIAQVVLRGHEVDRGQAQGRMGDWRLLQPTPVARFARSDPSSCISGG